MCCWCAAGAYLRDDALIAVPYLQNSQPMCWLTSKFRICGQCDDALIAVPYLQNSQPMCCWCASPCFCCVFAYFCMFYSAPAPQASQILCFTVKKTLTDSDTTTVANFNEKIFHSAL